jgi:hypothetical protein
MYAVVLSFVLVAATSVIQQSGAADCSLLSASDVSGVLGDQVVPNTTFGCEFDSLPGTTPYRMIRFIPRYPSTEGNFRDAARGVAQDNDALPTFAPVEGVGDEAYTWHDGLGSTHLDVRSGDQSADISVDLGALGTQDTAQRMAIAVQLGNIAVSHFTTGAVQASSDSAMSPPSGPDTAAEALTFTGALSGTLSVGWRGDVYVCAGGNFAPPSLASQTNTSVLTIGPIVGNLGNKQVHMSITRLNYAGPGSYDAAGVAFDVGSDHYYQVAGQPGTFTINADARGGSLQMDLAVNDHPNTTVSHVEGTWQCPPDQF